MVSRGLVRTLVPVEASNRLVFPSFPILSVSTLKRKSVVTVLSSHFEVLSIAISILPFSRREVSTTLSRLPSCSA